MEAIIRPQPRTLDSVHGNEYAVLSMEEKKARAFAKLQAYIDSGAGRARSAVERILGEVPQDHIVPVQHMRLAPMGAQFIASGQGKLLGDLHPHALDQMASRMGMPVRYMHDLQETEWGRHLVASNLNELA